jgi:hemoglobin/transferrin/lactoferrin receptor protein
VFTGLAAGPLTVTAEGSQVQQDSSVDAFLGQPGRFVNTTQLDGHDQVQRYRVSVDQDLVATAAWDSLDWRAYWQGTDTQQDTYELRKAVPPRTPPLQIDRSFDYRDHTLGAEATAVKAVPSGAYAHEVVYGFEAALTRIEEKRDGLQTNLANGSTTVTILGETLPVRDLPITDVTEVGVFAQDEITTAGARWTLVPALRIDYYRLDPNEDAIYREDNPHSTAVGLDDFAFAPKLGATWRFSDALHGFLQYAHGFRAPPPEDVNIGLELPLFNIRAVPNPDLKPERSDGYEAGLRWQSPGWNATASVYYNAYRDFIESKVNLGPDPVTGVTLFQSQNVAEARIYGAELSVAVQGAALSQRLEGWSSHVAAAWSRGDDLTRHEPLNSVQPSNAVMGFRYDAPSRRWGSELVVTAVGAKNRVDDSRVDLYETDGYVTVDWLLQWNFGHGLALNAGLFNLGDANYIEWADVQGRAANDPLVPYYARPGRNASITLHWQF